MLEEVCGAIGLIGLGSRAGIDPHAHRRGLRIGRILGSDLEEKKSRSDHGAQAQLVSRGLGGGGGRWETEAHGQSILECCGLSLDLARHRGREAPPQGRGRKGRPASQAFCEVQSESPGRHWG